MSRMPESRKGRRPRRQFDEEFRSQAVRLVLDDGKTIGAVARDLDLTPSALRSWVRRAQADRTHGRTGLTTAEREELARLRKENRELRTDRDILKSRGLLREAPGVRFAWIAAEKAEYTFAECFGPSGSPRAASMPGSSGPSRRMRRGIASCAC
jgi:transposase